MNSSWSRIRVLGRVFTVCAALLAGCNEGARTGTSAADAITADQVVPTGQACTPAGKHPAHARFSCTACHMCAGAVAFDPSVAGPIAAFDATAKTCSNVACHTVPPGTFTYWSWDWALDQPVSVTVPYGGEAGGAPLNWYAAPGMGCNACHGYPPKYNGVAYAWHSGMHGSGISNGNACQLCHPDASGAYVYGGLPSYANTSGGLIASCPPGTYCSAPGAITEASLHGNGVLDVTPSFNSRCMGCH